MKKILLGFTALTVANSSYALDCKTIPSCANLGYTMQASQCSGEILRCPFDLSNDNAVFCVKGVQCNGHNYDCSTIANASQDNELDECDGKFKKCTCASGYVWNGSGSGSCNCDTSVFKYTCTGSRQSIPNGAVSCNGKYKTCSCEEEYSFIGGECTRGCSSGSLLCSDGSCHPACNSNDFTGGTCLHPLSCPTGTTLKGIVYQTSGNKAYAVSSSSVGSYLNTSSCSLSSMKSCFDASYQCVTANDCSNIMNKSGFTSSLIDFPGLMILRGTYEGFSVLRYSLNEYGNMFGSSDSKKYATSYACKENNQVNVVGLMARTSGTSAPVSVYAPYGSGFEVRCMIEIPNY